MDLHGFVAVLETLAITCSLKVQERE